FIELKSKNKLILNCRTRPTVELLSFACPKESNQSKRHPLPLNSFASAPHPGRLAQRALADYTEHSLLRSLDGARRLTRLTLDAKARQRGRVNHLSFVIPAKAGIQARFKH